MTIKTTTPCGAWVQDWENAERFNLRRMMIVADYKPCSRKAVSRVGTLCLCKQHTQLALDGLVAENGHVADRSILRDVRKYPKKFPAGVYYWTKDLVAEAL